jgi:hypothetical protein
MDARDVPHDEFEGRFLGGGIWPRVERELGKGEKAAPVILMEVCEDAGVLFELLVGTF